MSHVIIQKTNTPPMMAEVGLVLMDMSLKLIAYDRGAAAILNHPSQPGGKMEPASCLPKEIIDIIRGRKPSDMSAIKTQFRMGKSEYTCRAYLVEPNNGSFPQH